MKNKLKLWKYLGKFLSCNLAFAGCINDIKCNPKINKNILIRCYKILLEKFSLVWDVIRTTALPVAISTTTSTKGLPESASRPCQQRLEEQVVRVSDETIIAKAAKHCRTWASKMVARSRIRKARNLWQKPEEEKWMWMTNASIILTINLCEIFNSIFDSISIFPLKKIFKGTLRTLM